MVAVLFRFHCLVGRSDSGSLSQTSIAWQGGQMVEVLVRLPLLGREVRWQQSYLGSIAWWVAQIVEVLVRFHCLVGRSDGRSLSQVPLLGGQVRWWKCQLGFHCLVGRSDGGSVSQASIAWQGGQIVQVLVRLPLLGREVRSQKSKLGFHCLANWWSNGKHLRFPLNSKSGDRYNRMSSIDWPVGQTIEVLVRLPAEINSH